MDNRRFDALTKAMAKSANRRGLLKGLFGLGGAAVAGDVFGPGDSEAARRPTPTPAPPKCPGNQTWNGSKCVCPAGLSQCIPNGGPACCNDVTIAPGAPGYSTCCDNACCQGTCYGEERCCATNARPGGLDPTNRICHTTLGDVCCPYRDVCCLVDGCCETVCTSGASGVDSCCPVEDFCPGGSESADRCCTGATICCDGGTDHNACVDLSQPAQCCIDSDCDTPPSGSTHCVVGTCVDHICRYTDCNAATEVCCPDNAGVYACRVGDECCLTSETCADTCEACVGFVCVDDPNTFPCGPENDPDKFCCPETNFNLCCGATQYECCGLDTATGVTRQCDADGKCCEAATPYFCADSNACCAQPCTHTGGKDICCQASEFGCNGQCCPDADTCCDGACCQGQCIRETPQGEICCPSDGSFVCDTTTIDQCCTDAQNCCSVDGCCDGHCDAGGRCCPADRGFICNGVCCKNEATCCGAGDAATCCSPGQCNASIGRCCAIGTFPCGESCCPNADTCCDGACCAGSCIREEAEPEICCPSDGNFVCNGNECCTDAQNCCSTDGCCSGQCDSTGHCCAAETGFLCAEACCPNENTCCGAGTEFEYCCPPGQCNAITGACCATGNFPCGETCCDAATEQCCPDLGVCVSTEQGVGCCSNDDCTSTGACLVGTCGTDGICNYEMDDTRCGVCGVCSEAGACLAGTCSGECEVCLQDADTGGFECQSDPACCPAYLVPSDSGCVNPCEPDPCPGGCWCDGYPDGSTICVASSSFAGLCDGPEDCPTGSECLYSGISNRRLCILNIRMC